MRPSYLYNGNSYTRKTASLYWDDPWLLFAYSTKEVSRSFYVANRTIPGHAGHVQADSYEETRPDCIYWSFVFAPLNNPIYIYSDNMAELDQPAVGLHPWEQNELLNLPFKVSFQHNPTALKGGHFSVISWCSGSFLRHILSAKLTPTDRFYTEVSGETLRCAGSPECNWLWGISPGHQIINNLGDCVCKMCIAIVNNKARILNLRHYCLNYYEISLAR